MAEGGPGRGRGGRGALIAKLLEMENRPRPAVPTSDEPAPPAGVEPHVPHPQVEVAQAPPPRSGGRGAILSRLAQQAPQPVGPPEIHPGSAAVPTEQPILQPTQARGRGKLLEALYQKSEPVKVISSVTKEETESKKVEPDVKSVTRGFGGLQISPDTPPVTFQGKGGNPINVTANYIRLLLKPGKGIYEYEVRFSPPVDDRSLIYKLLFGQHVDIFKNRRRTFDGVTLYVPERLPDEVANLTSVHPITNETHTINVVFKRERSMIECFHMYNVLFKNIQRELNLVELKKREYFSPELAMTIPQHKLEVWPGYVTSIDAYEGGVMLMCDVSSKVLRTQTVLDLISDFACGSGNRDWKVALQKVLIGETVMVKNPVKLYRVDDIEFSLTPSSKFTKSDGTEMDYIEYHRRKGIEIKDLNQPLLVHRPKPSKRPGGTGLLMLIPELCFLTGLTDEMRSDFKVMKDVATYTRINPNQRQLQLQKFLDNIRGNPNCLQMLDDWGLQVPEKTTDMVGRVLPPEAIYFGKGFVDKGSEKADWTWSATNKNMLETVDLGEWMVVFIQRDLKNAEGFVNMMGKVCPQLGVKLEYPDMQTIQNDRTETYITAIKKNFSSSVQLIVIIFPSARDDRYSAIKKLCCFERPIPSQVINSRTISRPDKLKSIVQKIALQINCKLGGALWSVNIPFKKAMICGIDTYHDAKNKAQCVAGFVASMNPSITRWHSQVFFQSTDREMVDGLRMALLTALAKYCEVNNQHPDTIVIFRDGVGDGQFKIVQEHEIPTLQKAFTSISPEYNPGFAFVVCQKRINQRIFMNIDNRNYDNPPPGTIVDHTITRRYMQDFFLVSQLVRQGTVTPTHYVVLSNNTRLDAEKLQKLTYKMCHLYYNWPGTIRVPAPCQYAHKLAFLVGAHVHKNPAAVLCDKLFFL